MLQSDEMLKELLKRCDNEMERNILQSLADTNYWHRKTRRDLVDEFHTDDRTIRDHISAMRERGIFIASDTHFQGYYLPRNLEEYRTFSDSYTSRAKTVFAINAKMTRLAREMLTHQLPITDDEGVPIWVKDKERKNDD